jgi:hypothetical protein
MQLEGQTYKIWDSKFVEAFDATASKDEQLRMFYLTLPARAKLRQFVLAAGATFEGRRNQN